MRSAPRGCGRPLRSLVRGAPQLAVASISASVALNLRLPSGVYLVKMEADGLVETGKIILLK